MIVYWLISSNTSNVVTILLLTKFIFRHLFFILETNLYRHNVEQHIIEKSTTFHAFSVFIGICIPQITIAKTASAIKNASQFILIIVF